MSSGSREEDGENQEFMQIGLLEAEFDKCRKQLFSELQKAHDRIADLDKEVNKKSGIIINLNKEVTEQKDSFAKNIASKEERLRKLSVQLKETLAENNKLYKENNTLKEKNEKEMQYLQTLNVEHKRNIERLNDHIKKMNIDMKTVSCKHRKETEQLEYDLNETKHALTCKESEIKVRSTELEYQINTLETEKRKLCEIEKTLNTEVENLKYKQMQLVQRFGIRGFADFSYYILDKSDEKRPTKLAEEFSELYDNQWGDAVEELGWDREEKHVCFLLDILMKADAICRYASREHCKTDMTYTITFPTESEVMQLSSSTDDESSGDTVPGRRAYVPEISLQFDSFREDIIWTEIQRFWRIKISDQLVTTVTNMIVSEHKIDVKRESLISYIKECVNICWSMYVHEPPVHIEFPDIQEDQKFDSSVFKPYTKSGKHLHYLVWPALYLHKDGPMLSKGIAQGRD